jgi:hypothetical protein
MSKEDRRIKDAVTAGLIGLALWGYLEAWKAFFTETLPVFGRKRELFDFEGLTVKDYKGVLRNELLFALIFIGYHLLIICTPIYGENWFDKSLGSVLFPIIYILVPITVGIHLFLWGLYEENAWYKSESKMLAICFSWLLGMVIYGLLNFYYQ